MIELVEISVPLIEPVEIPVPVIELVEIPIPLIEPVEIHKIQVKHRPMSRCRHFD